MPFLIQPNVNFLLDKMLFLKQKCVALLKQNAMTHDLNSPKPLEHAEIISSILAIQI